MFERKPESVGATVLCDPMFARQEGDGKPIVRLARCECGTEFEQAMLSERFMLICEKAGAAPSMLRDIPDLYVPVHCPPCERKDLGRAARIAESRSLPDIRPSFGERDHAAD